MKVVLNIGSYMDRDRNMYNVGDEMEVKSIEDIPKLFRENWSVVSTEKHRKNATEEETPEPSTEKVVEEETPESPKRKTSRRKKPVARKEE